jgi:acyl carrier protein
MEENKILEILQSVFIRFFKNVNLELTETSSAKDIEVWDSLNHMSLMGEIETEFKIQFEFFELMDFENVGDLIKGISSKIKGQ